MSSVLRSRGDGRVFRGALPGQAAHGPEHAGIVRARGRVFGDAPGLFCGRSLPIHRRQDRVRHIHPSNAGSCTGEG